MSLEALIGKPVEPPENVGFRPEPTVEPDSQDIPMSDRDLFNMLMSIRKRANRFDVFGAAPGPGRMVTERSLAGE